MVTDAGRAGLLLAMSAIGLALGQSGSKSEEPGSQMAVQRPGHWPQFRGPNRDNISPDAGLLKRWPPGGPPLAWKATGLGSGFSSVSVADGRLYTQGHIEGEEHVIALDEATGRKLWTVVLGPAERVPYAGSRSTPTVDGALLYLETVAGDVVCLDAQNTQVVWRKHLKRDFQGRPGTWGYAESPLVDGDRVVVTPGGKEAALVALDKRDGRVIWRVSVPRDDRDNRTHSRDSHVGPGVAAYCSAIVVDVGRVRQYIQFLQQGVVGIRADDGKFLWRDADGHFIMRGDGGTVALVEATPEQYREKGRFDQPDRSDRPARTYPVVTGGRLYLRDEGVLLCYDVRER